MSNKHREDLKLHNALFFVNRKERINESREKTRAEKVYNSMGDRE
jgi:hypothetical protein